MRNLLYIICLLFLTECTKNKTKHTTKEIILEAEYINFAWGYQHSVSLIDTNGIIRRYDNMNYANESWKLTDSLGFISINDLQYNYNLCDSIVGTINQDTIRQCNYLISGVTTNNLSERTNEANDAGVIAYYCYVWNKDVQKYQRLFLAQCGDWKQININANAQTILHLICKSPNNMWLECF